MFTVHPIVGTVFYLKTSCLLELSIGVLWGHVEFRPAGQGRMIKWQLNRLVTLHYTVDLMMMKVTGVGEYRQRMIASRVMFLQMLLLQV